MAKSAKRKPPDIPWRPSRAELQGARAKTVPDVIDRRLDVLFVGINPGLYSAAIGHHFGRPGNRFWPALFAGGFTPRLLSPFEEILLLDYRLGMTNLVDRATVTADELTRDELKLGATRLLRKVRRYRPKFVAPLGLTSFREAFSWPKAIVGRQPELVAKTPVWLLPNPSGLNAHHQPKDLARMFRQFYNAVHRKS
ncbi:MAG TPA: G/U mismatch-specific DNA glycosylase [Pirellulales bacterium]|nr:G/U mismatch-specific DNA glycosylase [Pirellulales bacterium]